MTLDRTLAALELHRLANLLVSARCDLSNEKATQADVEKVLRASGIVDPDLGVQTVHSDASRIQLLAERYLTKKKAASTDHGQQRLAI